MISLFDYFQAIEEEKLILKLNRSELQNEREMFKLEKEKSDAIIESERTTSQVDQHFIVVLKIFKLI